MRGRTGKSGVVRFVRYRPVPATRGALALEPAAAPVRPPGPRPPGLRLVRPDDGAEAEVRSVADAAVRLVVDILAGTRPAHQLSLVAVPAVCRALLHHSTTSAPGETVRQGNAVTRSRAVGRGGRIVPPKVLSNRLQRPAPTVAESVAVVVVAGRVHALALRLEHTRGRWRCTALETTAP
ncbi:Rv3235 family protein [Actinomadura sp. 1N219]|uniref:Rv3235 family protein n=1 Tax=Actinomadura sp. 1N219 TaxID=3375152 RepID=UPI0037940F2B